MSRRADHTERVSESFNALAPEAQPQMLAELFTRLSAAQATTAMGLITFWRQHDGQVAPPAEKPAARTRRRKADPGALRLQASHAE